jgi:hypothetical protein
MDNGASKHMTGFKQNLANYRDKKFNVKVELGDDGTYDIKGFGSFEHRNQGTFGTNFKISTAVINAKNIVVVNSNFFLVTSIKESLGMVFPSGFFQGHCMNILCQMCT